ncbi:hypothetical protein JTY93_17460 [Pseudomonas hygromyciniae]|uniref:Uncharacterized protein n=1 Tax=Pseudomonas hygromyciniae TaxID=2812000 RepID=A0ABX7JRS4_9PSED|nr:hypothetical protein JTY93_17460 [Pseudomonas hygromyciniae]
MAGMTLWVNLLDQGCQALEEAAALNLALFCDVAGGSESAKMALSQRPSAGLAF